MKLKLLLSFVMLLACLALFSCNEPPDTTKRQEPPAPACKTHTWSEWSYHNADALRTRHCETCGFCEYHPREEHVFEHWEYVAPTCCDAGGFRSTCSICPQVSTHYYTRQTDEHVFRLCMESDNVTLYECSVCGIYAWEYGRFGENDAFSYYICKDADPTGTYRMVITGTGRLPDFSHDNPPPWMDSIYLSGVTHLTLSPGITGIGDYAFSLCEDGTNPYGSVEVFVYNNNLLDLTPDAHWNGVRAVAQYAYDGVAVRSDKAVTHFLRFIVEQYDTESLTFGNMPAWNFWFSLYDMTDDGVEELILHTGSCEADAQYVFYTYRDATVREVGRISATHAGICGISDGVGVIWHHASQGWEAADRITLSDEGLVRETLFEARPVEEYTVFENAILLPSYERWHATNFSGGGKG